MLKDYINDTIVNGFVTINSYLNLKYDSTSNTLIFMINNNINFVVYNTNTKAVISYLESEQVKSFIINKRLSQAEEIKEISYLEFWINQFEKAIKEME